MHWIYILTYLVSNKLYSEINFIFIHITSVDK